MKNLIPINADKMNDIDTYVLVITGKDDSQWQEVVVGTKQEIEMHISKNYYPDLKDAFNNEDEDHQYNIYKK